MNKHSKEYILNKLQTELMKKQKQHKKILDILENQSQLKADLEKLEKTIYELNTAITEFKYLN